MREIKIRAPKGLGADVAKLALQAGAAHASVHSVFTYGPNEENDEIKVKTSTPTGKRVIDAITHAEFFRPDRFTVSSHEIKSIISGDDVAQVTKPLYVPPVDIYEDFWQASHVTPSFMCRTLVSAMLLAYATLRAKFPLMIGALLFTFFSQPIMAAAYSLTVGEWRLVRQGAKAFLVANAMTIVGAAAVTFLVKGPLLYDDFGGFSTNLLISLAVGVVAAFADVDDIGHRQLLALAAAFPYAKFPVWIGISLVLGFPGGSEAFRRLGIFAGNVAAMILAASLTYWAVGLRRGFLCRYAAR